MPAWQKTKATAWGSGSYGERDPQNKGMKRIGNLYEQIASIENLWLADDKARKGKKHQYGVMQHDKNRAANLLALRDMLLDKSFTTSAYNSFTIFEPKERQIFCLPYYPDRIVHHAVMNVLEPVFTNMFTADTYACIKGRGIHKAVYNLKAALKDRDNTLYCLKLDIKKFYPSVKHEILKQLLRRKIKDKDLLWLLDNIIDSADGLPIGNYLSQYFGNLYLTYFDHWLKEQKGVRYYFRYCDDIVILGSNKPYLHQLLDDIRMYLADNLRLTVKGNYQVFPVAARGIDFLGYRIYHTHIKLRKTIKKKFARMMSRRRNRASIASYRGWAKHCNSHNLLKKLIPHEQIQRLQHHPTTASLHRRQDKNRQGAERTDSGTGL